MATWNNQSQSNSSWVKQSQSSGARNTWATILSTWATEPRTWAELIATFWAEVTKSISSWSNQSKN